ncbi:MULTISPECIES: hypothetical protein [Bacillus]|uniref:hypothetical protein n=1 Tax=Bacillus TaxID=1386 RepID=UPI002E1C4805|nr:hypothetical protein [Bacillus smithii]MED1419952.1 hypothetical protein [Bacillus smithii]MED1455307.1 hypothetical protein [Bacillus smithii]
MTDKRYTVAGTDIEEVKRLNAQSGLTYNEAKQLLAEKMNQLSTADQKNELSHEKK